MEKESLNEFQIILKDEKKEIMKDPESEMLQGPPKKKLEFKKLNNASKI
jgi:hypothetical protein